LCSVSSTSAEMRCWFNFPPVSLYFVASDEGFGTTVNVIALGYSSE